MTDAPDPVTEAKAALDRAAAAWLAVRRARGGAIGPLTVEDLLGPAVLEAARARLDRPARVEPAPPPPSTSTSTPTSTLTARDVPDAVRAFFGAPPGELPAGWVAVDIEGALETRALPVSDEPPDTTPLTEGEVPPPLVWIQMGD